MAQKFWIGQAPTKCDLSGRPITTTFVDGRIPSVGSWGCLLPTVFKEHGGEYGLGRGQRYVKQDDGRFMKVEG